MYKYFLRALACAGLALGSITLTACGDPAAEDPIEDSSSEMDQTGAEGGAEMPEESSDLDEGMDSDTTEEDAEAMESGAMGGDDASQAVATGAGCAAFEGDERFIPVAELAAAIDDPDCAAAQSMTFVDARPELDYEFGHIPGAVNVPYFNAEAYADELPRDSWLVLYCECPHAEAVQLADALTSQELGFSMVKVIDEGLGGWRDLGRPIVTNEAESAGGEEG